MDQLVIGLCLTLLGGFLFLGFGFLSWLVDKGYLDFLLVPEPGDIDYHEHDHDKEF